MRDVKTIDIKISLLRQNITQAHIARELGVSIVMVNRVVNGIGRSKRVEDYLSNLILQEKKMSISKNLETDKKPVRNGHFEFRNGQHLTKVISEG
jgi:transcriptional regulator with XRE-family HTH domain